jgi:Zn-dependent protease with chaperone function
VSYIKHVLQPGETIRYEGSVHWILYLPAIILALVAAAILALSSLMAWSYGWILAAACLLIALLLAFRAWFIRWMTEIAVTDRRVIYARGFIQRHSIEVGENGTSRVPRGASASVGAPFVVSFPWAPSVRQG